MQYLISKLDAAEQQIRTAIDLYFLKGDYISVMTLAGAAEEICGNILKRRGVENILSIIFSEAVKQDLMISKSDLYNCASSLRNALKHATNEVEDQFVFDDEAATLMLIRAVINYQLCERALPTEIENFIFWVRSQGLLKNGSPSSM